MVAELERYALATAPHECCGILLGRSSSMGAAIERLVPTVNATRADPESRFEVPPLDILAAEQLAEDVGLEIIGFYHSHPSGRAHPSRIDLSQAWPKTSYVILGLEADGAVVTASWRLQPGQRRFEQEEIVRTSN